MLEIGEQISVIAVFGEDSRLRPLRFRWSGREIQIKDITYKWATSEGEHRLLHFSVTDGCTLYELSYDTASIIWMLEGVETETC